MLKTIPKSPFYLAFSLLAAFVCLSPSQSLARTLEASWYSHTSLVKEGTRAPGEPQIMANGKPFDENALTCAFRDYPLGTILRVTNRVNGRSVVVEVTDRLNRRYRGARIDLSKKAFSMIAGLKEGLVPVEVKRIDSKGK